MRKQLSALGLFRLPHPQRSVRGGWCPFIQHGEKWTAKFKHGTVTWVFAAFPLTINDNALKTLKTGPFPSPTALYHVKEWENGLTLWFMALLSASSLRIHSLSEFLLADIYLVKRSQCLFLKHSHLCISFRDYSAIWSHLVCVCPHTQ